MTNRTNRIACGFKVLVNMFSLKLDCGREFQLFANYRREVGYNTDTNYRHDRSSDVFKSFCKVSLLRRLV